MRELLEIHSRVSHVAATTTSTVGLLREVVRECAGLVGVERCGVYMREDREDLFRARAACAKGISLGDDVRRWRAGVPADGLTSEAVATRAPVIVTDALRDPRMIEAAVSRWSIRSIMAVPMVFGGEVIGLLLMDDIGRKRDFKLGDAEIASTFAEFAAATVVQTEERLDLRHKLGQAGRQLTAARRGADLDEQLADLVRRERPLEEITSRVAELLDRPCALHRADGSRVAAARPGLPAPLRRRHVVAPVMAGEEPWGRLVVTEEATPLSEADVGAVHRAATLIGLRVSAERQAAGDRWRAVSALTADLLRGGVPPAEVRRRAIRLGVSLDAKRVVALFAWPGDGERDELDPREVELALRERAPALAVHATTVAATVAAMIEVPNDEDADELSARLRADLEAVRAGLGSRAEPIVAISDAHRWAAGYQAAHREARQVLECIRRFSADAGPRVLTARELGSGGLFLATSDTETMSRFAEASVGRLLGGESKADLVPTLRAFFEQLCSVRGTATALGVHENTVRYRLDRVEQETGLAVMRDPDAQVGARLALLVLVLRGRLPAGAGAGDEEPR